MMLSSFAPDPAQLPAGDYLSGRGAGQSMRKRRALGGAALRIAGRGD
jgi:hypothetical protein